MAKILIVGHPASPLEQIRGVVGQRAGHQIYWFSTPLAILPRVISFGVPDFVSQNAAIRFLLKPLFLSMAIHKIKPDLIHVHYAQTGLMSLPLSRFHPLVVTVMGGDILPDQGYRGISTLPIRLLLEMADCITSKSDFMDAALDRIGGYRTKIRRITWGVDLDRFHPNRDVRRLRKAWSIPPGDIVFFDPRLAKPFYNKHIILKAFAKYLERGGKTAILLIAESFADSEYVVHLHRLADSFGISEKIRFTGHIPYGEMPDYYALADISISVPPSDGLPQTIYEAFACGSFLILSDLSQYADVVLDGVTARLVPVGDVNSLAEALQWAVQKVDIRKEAALLGRKYVQEYANFDVQAGLVNRIYNDLLMVRQGLKG